MSRRFLLFDLDGTLTDPAEGILGGVIFAMKKAGVPVPDQTTLESFIGPPLIPHFQEVCGVSYDTAVEMLAAYREYFAPRGIYENRVYPGIPEMLDALRAAGYVTAVATSKPEPFAETILTYFGLRERFDYVCGSTLDETRNKKEEVVAYALSCMGATPEEAVMIGDRSYDVVGAAACGLPCVGVLYGYGSRKELEDAGACALADSVPHLTDLLKTTFPLV